MKWPKWFNRFRWVKGGNRLDVDASGTAFPLREFVYLDEVSLRSLLSSQTGEMKEATSRESAETFLAETGAVVGANAAAIAKSEVSSRFQTSNSSTLQTSRKATVQSWFRDFHGIRNLRLIETVGPADPVLDLDSLQEVSNTSLILASDMLHRGALVEFQVKLRADPVFHLGTVVTEFAAMADDFAEMFSAHGTLGAVREMQPVNKVLQRLLAGLVPVRGEAFDYSVVVIDGTEYVVHKSLTSTLDLDHRPLEIVGVTEHLAYWKDIRRVLFSNAEFTILGRVARQGLDDTWTPVKLADIFKDMAPGLVDQINEAGMVSFDSNREDAPITDDEVKMGGALLAYVDGLLMEGDQALAPHERDEVALRIFELRAETSSATAQRDTFRKVHDAVCRFVDLDVSPERDLELREAARSKAGVPLFDGTSLEVARAKPPAADTKGGNTARLLDVEFIAIYW